QPGRDADRADERLRAGGGAAGLLVALERPARAGGRGARPGRQPAARLREGHAAAQHAGGGGRLHLRVPALGRGLRHPAAGGRHERLDDRDEHPEPVRRGVQLAARLGDRVDDDRDHGGDAGAAGAGRALAGHPAAGRLMDRALPQPHGPPSEPARWGAPLAARRVDALTLASRFPWLYLAGAFGLVFLFLPIFMVILFSFNTGRTTRFPIQGLTLDWYDKVLHDGVVLQATRASIEVGIGTMLLSALLGVPAALALTRHRLRGRSLLSALFVLPVAVPTLILAVALLTLLSTLKLPLSLGTVVIGHTVYCVPLMFLIVRARLLDMDRFVEEAARDLGASPWQTFWTVTFPLVRSAIFGAMLLVFAQSF